MCFGRTNQVADTCGGEYAGQLTQCNFYKISRNVRFSRIFRGFEFLKLILVIF